MEQKTLGQTLDDLVFRMGRVENWIVQFTKLQELRVSGAKELQIQVLELGNAILNSSIFPDAKKLFKGLRELTKGTGQETFLIPEGDYLRIGKIDSVTVKDKGILLKGKINERIKIGSGVECPGCHRQLKSKLALKSHIVSDANWGKKKFRNLHREVREKEVWRA